MSEAYNISNLVLGVLGSAGAVEGLTKIFGDRFPTAQLKSLNDTLKTTHGFFAQISEGKIILTDDFRENATKDLKDIDRLAKEFESLSHERIRDREQLVETLKGLGRQIQALTDRAAKLNEDIVTNSERQQAEAEQKAHEDGGEGAIIGLPPVPPARMNASQEVQASGSEVAHDHPEYAEFLKTFVHNSARLQSAELLVPGVTIVSRAHLVPVDANRAIPADGSVPAMVANMEQAGESPQTIAGAKAVGEALQSFQKSIAQMTRRLENPHVSQAGSNKRTD